MRGCEDALLGFAKNGKNFRSVSLVNPGWAGGSRGTGGVGAGWSGEERRGEGGGAWRRGGTYALKKVGGVGVG